MPSIQQGFDSPRTCTREYFPARCKAFSVLLRHEWIYELNYILIYYFHLALSQSRIFKFINCRSVPTLWHRKTSPSRRLLGFILNQTFHSFFAPSTRWIAWKSKNKRGRVVKDVDKCLFNCCSPHFPCVWLSRGRKDCLSLGVNVRSIKRRRVKLNAFQISHFAVIN